MWSIVSNCVIYLIENICAPQLPRELMQGKKHCLFCFCNAQEPIVFTRFIKHNNLSTKLHSHFLFI